MFEVTKTLRNYTGPRKNASNRLARFEVLKLGKPVVKEQFPFADRPVAVFTDENLGNSLPFRGRLIDFFPINEHDHVGILFDGAALAQVR